MSAKTERMSRRLKAHKISAVLEPGMIVKAGIAKIDGAIYVELLDGRVAAIPDNIQVRSTENGRATLEVVDIGTVVMAPPVDDRVWQVAYMGLLDGRVVPVPKHLRVLDTDDGNAVLLPAEPAWRIEAGQVLRRGEKPVVRPPVVCPTCGR